MAGSQTEKDMNKQKKMKESKRIGRLAHQIVEGF